jgi:hypothetical protein
LFRDNAQKLISYAYALIIRQNHHSADTFQLSVYSMRLMQHAHESDDIVTIVNAEAFTRR